ncbi:MAG TPA: flagellar basal-body rod protein FlgG [Armatimonadota bacterium]|nr:flagellar basal-body rod protein FlgG [Armatimonadota bacterium]
MIRALWTAASGMEAQQLNVDVIANNLANVNTTGFKKSRVDFQDVMYQTTRAAGSPSARGVQVPTGIQVGLGTRPVATQKMFTQGDFTQTGNSLDMVIEGQGFFQVQRPDGTIAYTRDGSMKLDSQGRLVNSDGYVLQPEIVIPAGANDVSIGSDGTVSVNLPGQTAPQEVGQIQVSRFINPAGLSSAGRNLFLQTASSGDPETGTPGLNGMGTIAQGFVEMSNVKVVEEMVNMIVAQRAYEINSKGIQTADQMLELSNNLRR